MNTSEFSISNHAAMRVAVRLSDEMLRIAEKGFLTCEDDSCILVYGIIRDCGYRIRKTVEREQHALLPKYNDRPVMH
jgi:hypothetical protein